jgi:hypothetical protein
MVSIWFFIGVLLLVYGILICAAGIHEWVSPPAESKIVLSNLHAGVWWGALLIVLGAFYAIKFSPGKGR